MYSMEQAENQENVGEVEQGGQIPPAIREDFEFALAASLAGVTAEKRTRREHGGFPRGDAESIFSKCVATATEPDSEVFARYTRFTYPEFVRLCALLEIPLVDPIEPKSVGRPKALSLSHTLALLLHWLSQGASIALVALSHVLPLDDRRLGSCPAR
jgi:hypothetical protein